MLGDVSIQEVRCSLSRTAEKPETEILRYKFFVFFFRRVVVIEGNGKRREGKKVVESDSGRKIT